MLIFVIDLLKYISYNINTIEFNKVAKPYNLLVPEFAALGLFHFYIYLFYFLHYTKYLFFYQFNKVSIKPVDNSPSGSGFISASTHSPFISSFSSVNTKYITISPHYLPCTPSYLPCKGF